MGAGLTGPHAGKWPLKFDELLSSGTLALSSCRGQQRIARHRFGRNHFAPSLPARPRAPFPCRGLLPRAAIPGNGVPEKNTTNRGEVALEAACN